ncbi:hypothetical protein RND81_13G053600 [Saponaria officinalis]|uniref:HMA domain-containing protein n=1 Tax=Saponaria officinalis TaxID=3572 RepID=A0AAW1H2Q6_SAPOF
MKDSVAKRFFRQKPKQVNTRRVHDVMMGAGKGQPLFFAENLSIPTFQVVVMSANMGCSSCRSRVHKLLSKMIGFEEYSVDVLNKEVMIKGDLRRLWSTKEEAA